MVVILFKVLVSRHEEIRSRMRGRELDKSAIGGVAHTLPAMAGLRKLGNGSQDSQEMKGRDSRISKIGLQTRTMQHIFEFSERCIAHNGDNIAPQDSIDDLGRRSRAGNQT